MTVVVPNLNRAIAGKNGIVPNEWIGFFTQFSSAPSGALSLLIGDSPFIYTAKEPGNIAVIGGTVSALNLIRGSVIIDVTGMKLISVEKQDKVEITYSVLPVVQFLPRY